MKKILAFVAAAVVLMSTVVSCNKSGGNSDSGISRATNDSITRLFGELNGEQLKMMLKNDSTIDSEQLLSGIRAGFGVDTARSFMRGHQIGTQMKMMLAGIKEQYGIEIDERVFMKEVIKAFEKKEIMDDVALQAKSSKLDSIIKNIEKAKLRKNETAGADYVKARLAEGYKKTASGLVYKVVAEGNGANFTDADSVEVHYVGKHINGDKFDEGTRKFTTNGVVPGFGEALKLMKPGSKIIAVLPHDIAYGEEGQRSPMTRDWAIEPYETLVFEMEAK